MHENWIDLLYIQAWSKNITKFAKLPEFVSTFMCMLMECNPHIDDDCCALVSTSNEVEPWEVIYKPLWYFDLLLLPIIMSLFRSVICSKVCDWDTWLTSQLPQFPWCCTGHTQLSQALFFVIEVGCFCGKKPAYNCQCCHYNTFVL